MTLFVEFLLLFIQTPTRRFWTQIQWESSVEFKLKKKNKLSF